VIIILEITNCSLYTFHCSIFTGSEQFVSGGCTTAFKLLKASRCLISAVLAHCVFVLVISKSYISFYSGFDWEYWLSNNIIIFGIWLSNVDVFAWFNYLLFLDIINWSGGGDVKSKASHLVDEDLHKLLVVLFELRQWNLIIRCERIMAIWWRTHILSDINFLFLTKW